MPTIHFNGKTYNDLAEMPAAEREMYDQLMSVMVDEDGDGIPDIFEGDVVANIINLMKTSGYENQEGVIALEKMSPVMRDRLSRGMAKLYELGLISGMPDLPNGFRAPSWEDAQIRPSRPIIPSPSAIQEERGNLRWLVLLLLALMSCGFAAAVLFYLRGGL